MYPERTNKTQNYMKTKCYSVRLQSLTQISEKAYKAVAFDGSEAIIPASQVFGLDYEVTKSDAYWISAWILERKNLQYSNKKVAWFNEAGNKLPSCTKTTHIPAKESPVESNAIENLSR